MKRAVIKTQEGYCNLVADKMDTEGKYISIYNGEKLVGMFNIEYVKAAYISEKGE